ncbi:MAG: hypothetical protein HC933_11175 [Pleurocapsa sp. SU_196_0]|nr:hypothetical protein [Pleurocapsa sp. SU_196_0]
MKKTAHVILSSLFGLYFGACAAPRSFECTLLSAQEIEKALGAKFLAPEVTTPDLLGSSATECNWFREGERGWVTTLQMTVSTGESRAKKGAALDGKQHLEFLRLFLARDGQMISLGDGAWVNWVDIPGGMGNGVLIFREGEVVVALILSDQDDLTPGIEELTSLGKTLENRF